VTHFSRLSAVVIDVPATGHDEELGFWQAATGESLAGVERYPEYHGARLHGQDLVLLVQRLGEVDEAGSGDARVHLDIHTDDLEAEVARLERLGALRVRQLHEWWVMRDPAGLLFCVVAEPPGALTEANARRWA
jgi:hypothetical protein